MTVYNVCEVELPGLGTCMLEIHDQEVETPHFHLTKRSDGFDCRICIDKSRYMDRSDELTDEQARALFTFLCQKSKYKMQKGACIWRSIKIGYEIINGGENLRETKTRPPKYANINKHESE